MLRKPMSWVAIFCAFCAVLAYAAPRVPTFDVRAALGWHAPGEVVPEYVTPPRYPPIDEAAHERTCPVCRERRAAGRPAYPHEDE